MKKITWGKVGKEYHAEAKDGLFLARLVKMDYRERYKLILRGDFVLFIDASDYALARRHAHSSMLRLAEGLAPLVEDDLSDCIEDEKKEASPIEVLERIEIYPDGDQWCVLVGDNIQEGVCGFGITPMEAFKSYVENLRGEEDEKKQAGNAKV